MTLDDSEWLRIHDRVVPECIVATSAKKNLNIDVLLETVEQALLQVCVCMCLCVRAFVRAFAD